MVVSSYNEPLITSEWAVGIFKEAKAAGLMCAYVSNGNNTPEVMEYLRPYLSAYKVDLKCMQEKNYRKLGGVLQEHPGRHSARAGNGPVGGGRHPDHPRLQRFKRGAVGCGALHCQVCHQDIPWHVTAFHKDYKMTEPDNTDARTLLRAAEIGREAGLRYVYAGNIPGGVEEYENTYCSKCGTLLIRRSGYVIREYHVAASGVCPSCKTPLPGLWTSDPGTVHLNGRGAPVPIY